MKKDSNLATAPIKSLTLTLGIPIMISMALQAVYNIVDSAFVANIPETGEQAATALALAYPIQMLMLSFAIGTGVGSGVLLARCFGEGNFEKANKTTGNTIILGFIMTIAFMLFGFLCTKPYISSQTQNPLVLEMGVDYLSICCIACFGLVFFGIYEKLIQSTGRTIYSTIGQITGAIVNIVLDPILIYGWCGFDAYGVKGAAYATVIGQIAAFLVCLFFFLTRCKEVDSSAKYLKFSVPIIKEIYIIGLPAILAQALTSGMTYALNLILGSVNETLVTAYGLYYKVQCFVLMMVYGLKDGCIPIISFSYGMKNKERIKQGVKYSLLYTMIIMILGLILLEILANPFAKMFGLSGDVNTHFVNAMRIASISFIFAGVNITLQGIFQALGSGIDSVIISLGRQLLFILPIAFIFAKIAIVSPEKTWLIWLTFIIGEVLTFIVAYYLMRRNMKIINATLDHKNTLDNTLV